MKEKHHSHHRLLRTISITMILVQDQETLSKSPFQFLKHLIRHLAMKQTETLIKQILHIYSIHIYIYIYHVNWLKSEAITFLIILIYHIILMWIFCFRRKSKMEDMIPGEFPCKDLLLVLLLLLWSSRSISFLCWRP